jgi:hypothetical protein
VTTYRCPTNYKQSKKKVKKVLGKSKISVYLCTPQEREVLKNVENESFRKKAKNYFVKRLLNKKE